MRIGVVMVSLAIAGFSGGAAWAQPAGSNAATYISKEEVDAVNRTPGVDRTIKVVSVGDQNFAVGVIHRGAIAAPGVAAFQSAPDARPCGAASATPPTGLTPGLLHDKQTEGYYIISGEGILLTGGSVINGREEASSSDVVTTLNGPSCRGPIGGADVVKRFVKTGDIVVIPPGVPHGWYEVKDHVDYVSFRPSRDTLTAGYVHPAIK